MQSFTTQSHQRNYQGYVVVESPNPTLVAMRQQQQRHKVLFGITVSVMALAVAITSGLWGATTVHNHQLKNQLHALQNQTTPVVAHMENDDTYHCLPMTLETVDNTPTTPNHNEKTMPAPQDSAPYDATPHDTAPYDHSQRPPVRRAPISEKQHDTHPLPAPANFGNRQLSN